MGTHVNNKYTIFEMGAVAQRGSPATHTVPDLIQRDAGMVSAAARRREEEASAINASQQKQ